MLHDEVKIFELLLLSEMQLFKNIVSNLCCLLPELKNFMPIKCKPKELSLAWLFTIDFVLEGLYGGGSVGEVGLWSPHGHLRDLGWDMEGGVLGGSIQVEMEM